VTGQVSVVLQPTHLPAARSHTGLVPVHAAELVAVHSTHEPSTVQMGALEVGHARAVPPPKLPSHVWQSEPEVSAVTHTGNAALQSAEVVHG